jgi:hypothetical protein
MGLHGYGGCLGSLEEPMCTLFVPRHVHVERAVCGYEICFSSGMGDLGGNGRTHDGMANVRPASLGGVTCVPKVNGSKADRCFL